MNIYLALFVLTTIVVNLVDLSGVVDTVKHWIWKWVWKEKRPYQDFPFKPFSCSYCMTHHLGVIYLLIVGQFSLLAYAYLLCLSFLTPVIKDVLYLLRDFITKMIETIYDYFSL